MKRRWVTSRSGSLLIALVISAVISPGAYTGDAVAGTAAVLGGEVEIRVPDGWRLTGDSAQFPFQFVHDNPVGEVLVFKSELLGHDVINDANDLRLSVKKVVDSVIMRLPKAQMLTSTGIYETVRTSFTLEFLSLDTNSNVMVRHRFTGILYRTAEHQQSLFTIWGKTASASYDSLAVALTSIAESFRFTGASEATVFPSTGSRAYWYLMVVVAISVVLLLYSRRRYARSARFQNVDSGKIGSN